MLQSGEETSENIFISKVTKLSDKCGEVKSSVFVSRSGLEVE